MNEKINHDLLIDQDPIAGKVTYFTFTTVRDIVVKRIYAHKG